MLTWIDAQPFVHGTGFAAPVKAHFYDRLPQAAQNTTRSTVWSLSRDTAGMFATFATNATGLQVNATYIYSLKGMWHFPSTGVAGFDLYAYDEGNQTWRWTSTTNPFEMQATQPFVQKLETANRHRGSALVRYRLHFPLYNGVSQVSLGFGGKGAVLVPDAIKKRKPIVWYGTSIAQGGVASRPGMAFTNIISRRLDREVLNFGFSGNCLMEPGVMQWLAQIDAALFIIDCSWNMGPDMIANRTVPLVRQLRRARPSTPIVLAEGTEDGSAWTIPAKKTRQATKRANLAAAYKSLVHSPTSPDANLHYVTGRQLYDFAPAVGGVERAIINPTVGGCHPSDLGMLTVANFYSKFLPPLLTGVEEEVEEAGRGLAAAAAVETGAAHLAPPTPSAAGAATVEEAKRHEEAMAFIQSDGKEGETLDDIVAPSPLPTATTWMAVGGKGGLTLMGRAFNDTLAGEYFDRLPGAAKGVVREEVWQLSRDATGMHIAFRSRNVDQIHLNYTLDAPADPLWHMPASGTSGADLFRYDEATKSYRFVAALMKFPAGPNKPFEVAMASGLDPTGSDRFLLFLPLRKHVVAASIGVVGAGATLQQDEAYAADGFTVNGRKPIVWYGTSIDQGGVASRPGATYTNVLTRSLERTVLNFGFAGNGLEEISVMEWLVKLPAALLVIDCLPNITPEEVRNRTVPLVNYVRSHGHATTPIVLAAGTTYGAHWFDPAPNDDKRDALEAEYKKLIAAGDANLHLVANRDDALFAYDELINPTVGGTHPSDLGHREIAAFYEQYLAKLLKD